MKVFLYQIDLLLSEIEDREVGKKLQQYSQFFFNINEHFIQRII